MRQTIEYYRDPYGCTASIRNIPMTGTYLLRVCTAQGDLFHIKGYDTRHGARVALGRMSDGMMKLTKKEEC